MIFSLAPIIDLRDDQPRHRRLPAELATLGLWGAWGLLLGGGAAPLALVSLAGLWRFGSSHLRRSAPAVVASVTRSNWSQSAPLALSSIDRGRAALADHFGWREVDLFRAQHAAICTLHHDTDGAIVKFECRERLDLGAPVSRRCHAHPVS